MWGGLPKDADVFNLELKGDLEASNKYIENIKLAMKQVKGMPSLALGGDELPTNLSGVALQIAFMPLIDSIKTKQSITKNRLENVNRMISKISIDEGLLEVGAFNPQQIYNHKVTFGDILPKDIKAELESIQQELKMGLESREGAAIRLKKDNIEELFSNVAKDKETNPMFYGKTPMILSPGQILIDAETGEKIAENEVENVEGDASKKKGLPPEKITGKNKDGQDLKIISGNGNSNPGDSN